MTTAKGGRVLFGVTSTVKLARRPGTAQCQALSTLVVQMAQQFYP